MFSKAKWKRIFFATSTLVITLIFSCESDKTENLSQKESVDWPGYLGGSDRNHYSLLNQINIDNVSQLQVAWKYNTGDPGQMQCNPIIVDGILYGVSSTNEVFALEASTGKELWKFAAEEEKSFLTNRGVTYWENGSDKRILFSYKEWLISLNAETGQPIQEFGLNGRISLKSGLGDDVGDKYLMSRTPGTIYENLIIMPLVMLERAGSAPGYIQAFDIETGSLEWVFYTIPRPGDFGYDTWPENVIESGLIGAANNWAGMAIDLNSGIIYVPTGSASPDFYGGDRKGKNLFANTLLALDAKTGKRIWHYQLVHHDLWDRDPPAPPNLITLTRGGKEIDAVAQVTKSGHVFVFNRETGESIFPIEEVEVPPSVIPGESAWQTQPIPVLPAPFSRQTLTESDLNTYSPDYDSLLQAFRGFKKGMFVPFSETPTIIYPGLNGGAEWGGAAVDTDGIMYVNSNEIPWVEALIPTDTADRFITFSKGEIAYRKNCSSCHGMDRSGSPASGFPSLVNIAQKFNKAEMASVISNGKGMMPGFTELTSTEIQNLIDYLFDKEEFEVKTIANESSKPKPAWKVSGHKKFLDSKGLPAITPPWGTLTAIDLNTGEHKWRITLGDSEEYKGTDQSGTENYGGPIVTAGGLLFIAATKDGKFRAFDKETGELLWETTLPAAAFATPSTYKVNGKQYVVIACGGTKLGTQKGDSYVAFALP